MERSSRSQSVGRNAGAVAVMPEGAYSYMFASAQSPQPLNAIIPGRRSAHPSFAGLSSSTSLCAAATSGNRILNGMNYVASPEFSAVAARSSTCPPRVGRSFCYSSSPEITSHYSNLSPEAMVISPSSRRRTRVITSERRQDHPPSSHSIDEDDLNNENMSQNLGTISVPCVNTESAADKSADSTVNKNAITTTNNQNNLDSTTKAADNTAAPTGSFITRARKRKAVIETTKKNPTANKKADLKQAPTDEENNVNCCICMCEPTESEKATINGCNHIFCFSCIELWSDRENTCPLCKNRFTKIDRVTKPPRKRGAKSKNTKKVKKRDQRADLVQGNPLQGLFATMEATMAPQIARLIFSGTGLFGGNIVEMQQQSTLNSSGYAPNNNTFRRARASASRWNGNSGNNIDGSSHHVLSQNQRGLSRQMVAGCEDDLFLSDVEMGSDDDEAFGSFVQRVRSLEGAGEGIFDGLRVLRPSGVPHHHPQGMHRMGAAARSFATNADDIDAGDTAENALEIEDQSGDENDNNSDDEVEIVRVMQPSDAALP